MEKESHDTHVLKKVGEALAFTRVGLDTFERGETAFIQVFSEEEYDQILKELEDLGEELETFVTQSKEGNVVTEKAEKTANKLVNMRDLYINDEWEDQVELLEWLGFFQGAAFVHWGLVFGYTSGGFVPILGDTAGSAMAFHENLLQRVAQALVDIGGGY